VQLTRHDLLQLDEASLSRLSEEQLRALSVKLLADLKAAHERLEQNSHNSSRPPSSELPWQGKSEKENEEGTDSRGEGGTEAGAQDRNEETPCAGGEHAKSQSGTGPKRPRPPGQQPGASGHGRTQSLPIDQEEHHHPGQCAVCGATLPEGSPDRPHSASLAIDLRETSDEYVGLEVIQTKHIYHESQCACGHWMRAEPGHCDGNEQWGVALSERHLVGALLCALSLRMRLSRRRIQEFLGDWLGLQLRVATINQCLHEAARALEPVLDEQLLPQVRNSTIGTPFGSSLSIRSFR